MSDLTVDPSLLMTRAAKFRDAATEQVAAGSLDQSQSESDIAAFGEINAVLHEQFRMVKDLQARSWAGLGNEHDAHAANLSSAARGYSNTDDLNARTLRSAPEGVVTCGTGPQDNSSRPGPSQIAPRPPGMPMPEPPGGYRTGTVPPEVTKGPPPPFVPSCPTEP